MDLRQLKYFRTIVDQGSFRKAADALHVSPPALSLSIKGLEDELGVSLLDRKPGAGTHAGDAAALRNEQRSLGVASARLILVGDEAHEADVGGDAARVVGLGLLADPPQVREPEAEAVQSGDLQLERIDRLQSQRDETPIDLGE